MLAYIIRRIINAIPILIGVNVITFALFFMVNTPDDMARMHLGQKHVTQTAINRWKQQHGYDKPLFFNKADTGVQKFTDTLFFTKSFELFTFNFGKSDQGRDISHDIGQRMWPSLALAIPALFVGLGINISFALLIALFRGTYFDVFGVTLCVIMMSISGLFYIIVGQHVIGKLLRIVPMSG